MKAIKQLAPMALTAALFAMWFVMVLLGITNPDPFITALTAALGGLGGAGAGYVHGRSSK